MLTSGQKFSMLMASMRSLETGDIFDPELAKRLKENVYEAGSREEADELYRKFRGKDPSIEPLLRVRGLDDGS